MIYSRAKYKINSNPDFDIQISGSATNIRPLKTSV